jgi:hypothetical protein
VRADRGRRDARDRASVSEAGAFGSSTTADITHFIAQEMRRHGLDYASCGAMEETTP